MSYTNIDKLEVRVLLDGKPAGATLHHTRDSQFRDWPCPRETARFWNWELFSKALEPDGKPHRLTLQFKWYHKPKEALRFVSEGMHWMSFHMGKRRILASAADLEGVAVECADDGISYLIPADCPVRRFFFGLSEVDGLGTSRADQPAFVVNPSRVIEEQVDAYQFRLIGGNRRFGNGYRRLEDGQMMYFAFYGFPNRNDDYFYNAEISREEFYEIESRYDCMFSSEDRGEGFYEKYIQNHTILLEGESRLL